MEVAQIIQEASYNDVATHLCTAVVLLSLYCWESAVGESTAVRYLQDVGLRQQQLISLWQAHVKALRYASCFGWVFVEIACGKRACVKRACGKRACVLRLCDGT